MIKPIEGMSFRLCDVKGQFLGVVTIPYEAGQSLVRHSYCRFPYYTPEGRVMAAPIAVLRPLEYATQANVKDILIHESHIAPGHVELEHVQLGEFENADGCSFSPSAWFIRNVDKVRI